MQTNSKIVIGVLLVIIVSAGVYVSMGKQVRVYVDLDKSTFYVPHEKYPWIWTVSGREYNRLFSGSTNQYRDRSTVVVETIILNTTEPGTYYTYEMRDYNNGSGHIQYAIPHEGLINVPIGVLIRRTTGYQNGAIIIDSYNFDGLVDDVELFPISHTVEVINAKGLFYRYTVDDLKDTGKRRKLTGETKLSFGLDMNVELHPNYRWAWIGRPYGSDSLSAQYDVTEDYVVFNVRLFDPEVTDTGVLRITLQTPDTGAEGVSLPPNLNVTVENYNVMDNGTPRFVNMTYYVPSSTNTFNDSLTTETIAIIPTENITRYIAIPLTTDMLGSVNLTISSESGLLVDLIHYWKLDNVVNLSNATDEVGDWTLDKTNGDYVTGKINNAYNVTALDGLENNTLTWTEPSVWTMTGWYNVLSIGHIVAYIRKDGSNSIEVGFGAGDGKLMLNYIEAGGNEWTRDYATSNDNSWHFFVATIDHDADTLTLWRDDNDQVANGSLTREPITGNIATLTFGVATGPHGLHFGINDEVGIWERALTSGERELLYNSGDGLSYTAFLTGVLDNFTLYVGDETAYFNDSLDAATNINLTALVSSAYNSGVCDCAGCVDDGTYCLVPIKFNGNDSTDTFSYSGLDFNFREEIYNETELANGTSLNYSWDGLNLGQQYIWCTYIMDENNSFSNCDSWNFTTEAGANMSLEGFLNQNVSVELGSPVNVTAVWINGTIGGGGEEVCVDVDYPGYGVNYSCGVNSTSFILNVSYFYQTEFNDTSTSKDATVNETLFIRLDNRSNLTSLSINVSSLEGAENITIYYYDNVTVFNGNLSGDSLEYDKISHSGTLSTEANLTYLIAGENTIYYNLTATPKTLRFGIWSLGLDVGNEFVLTDKLNSTTYILNSSTNAVVPWWTWDNFTSDGRTSRYETGTGTYTSEVDLTDERYEGESSSSARCSTYGGSKSDSDNVKMTFLLQNISRFKELSFEGYCAASASAIVYSGVGADGSHGAGQANCVLAITNSDTASTYKLVDQVSASASASGIGSTGDSDSGSASTTGTYTLKRVEDDSASYTYKVYRDNVLIRTTASLDGDINLAYVGSSSASCNSNFATCGSCPTGSGNQNAWINHVQYAGMANNYTNDWNYTTNGTMASPTVFTAPSPISIATLTTIEYLPTGCTITYYLSNDNSTTWEQTYSASRHAFTSTAGNLTWMADLNCTGGLGAYGAVDTPAIIEYNLEITPSIVNNISIDAGADGTIDFYFNDTINDTTSPINFTFNLTGLENLGSYPVLITAFSAGEFKVNDSLLNMSPNPLTLTTSIFEDCTECEIRVDYGGDNFTVDDVQFQYLGGNYTVPLTVHAVNTSNYTKVYDLTYYHSGWVYGMPLYVDYLEFIPQSATAKNVTPYGQRSNNPIFNITMYNYDTYGANFSIHSNDTHSCVNMTASETYNKSDGYQLYANWTTIFSNISVDEHNGVWMWSDYQCNYSNWTFWEPELSFRACCVGCDVCDNSTS